MDVTSAIGLLVVAILVLIVLYVLVKLGVRFGKYLAINSILGIIVLVIANIILVNFGLTVPIDLVTILVCALAGIPG
ncbi:MAG: pro-sigmaK processing inhibitor BofA family protein, partial [Halobacteriota archaeon]